jgi:hydroxymethylbilane synthase
LIECEEVVIRTHGDEAATQPLDADFPPDGFVSAIEKALLRGDLHFAVHSYKDLPTSGTAGLTVAAVPAREVAHDVLISDEALDLDRFPGGLRVGTSSPRRAAQIRRVAEVSIVPMRGNVPTRIAKVETGELDAVIVAAAGVRRLGLSPVHMLDLPVDRFVPAPAQGALAVQCRDNDPLLATFRLLEHAPSRRLVEAEREFLRDLRAGCHTPVGAHAMLIDGRIRLHGQIYSEDGLRVVEGVARGDDPVQLGADLARRLSTLRSRS